MKKSLLIVGHGSRHEPGNEEIREFARRWRQRHPEWCIHHCFIELADVLLDEGMDQAAQDADEVLVLPLILTSAGHVKHDIPHAMESARTRHPGVRFECAPPLGLSRDLFNILRPRVTQLLKQLAMPDPRTTGLILLGRGTSDTGANGDMARLARWIYEDTGCELVDIAFTGITWPRLESVVARQVRLGLNPVVIQPVYLFTGVLIERIEEQVERLRLQYPQTQFALGSYFGFDDGVFELLDRRAAGVTDPETPACAPCPYRIAATEGGCAGHGHHHGHEHSHGHAHGHSHSAACGPHH